SPFLVSRPYGTQPECHEYGRNDRPGHPHPATSLDAPVFHHRTPMKSRLLALSLLSLLLATAAAQAVPEGDKPARKDAPAKRPGDGREEFLKQHPELKETLEKLKGMSPEERQAWLKEHPEVAAKIEKAKAAARERAENLTPEQKEKLKGKLKERAENLSPEQKEKLREKMKERFEQMTPEQKAEVLKKHPELKEKLEGAKK
ncbi:MAG: hypothetical protein RI910_399, partial [Verrucomicrobiota bacterium]